MALAVVLRWRCFHAYADDWDPCEYVWAVGQHHLPHSPYVLHLLFGLLIARVLPADTALSALSLLLRRPHHRIVDFRRARHRLPPPLAYCWSLYGA